MKLRVMARLLEIQRVLVRHGLDDFVRATHLYRPLRFLFYQLHERQRDNGLLFGSLFTEVVLDADQLGRVVVQLDDGDDFFNGLAIGG